MIDQLIDQRLITFEEIAMVREQAERSRHAEVQRRLRERQKKMGLCTDCSAPAVPGLTTCTKHRENSRRRSKELVDWKKANGYCQYGGCYEPRVTSYCQHHREQHNRNAMLKRFLNAIDSTRNTYSTTEQ